MYLLSFSALEKSIGQEEYWSRLSDRDQAARVIAVGPWVTSSAPGAVGIKLRAGWSTVTSIWVGH